MPTAFAPLDPLTLGAALMALAMLTLAALRAWAGWLALKHRELDARLPEGAPVTGQRIEMADLKERIRKLEAIAAGVDL